MLAGDLVALALLGEHVHDHGAVGLFGELEVLDQQRDVVAVDRAEVAQAVFFEQRRFDEEVLRLAFPFHPDLVQALAARGAAEELLDVVVDPVVGGVGRELVEVLRHRADVAGDRPLVVVEDDDEAFGGVGDVVERLHAHAAGEGGVAAEGDDVFGGAEQVARGGQPEGGRQRGARMAGAEGIVGALGAVEEAGEPVALADAAEAVAVAAGEQLVDVALVGDVEDELVARCIENAVQGDRELDHAEVGPEVPAVVRGDLDEFLADLLGEAVELVDRQGLHVGRAGDGGQKRRQRRGLGRRRRSGGWFGAHRRRLVSRPRVRSRRARAWRRRASS